MTLFTTRDLEVLYKNHGSSFVPDQSTFAAKAKKMGIKKADFERWAFTKRWWVDPPRSRSSE